MAGGSPFSSPEALPPFLSPSLLPFVEPPAQAVRDTAVIAASAAAPRRLVREVDIDLSVS